MCKILKKNCLTKKNLQKKTNSYYTSRYCNQNKFNLCGGVNIKNKLQQVGGSKLNYVKDLPPMTKKRQRE